MSMYLRRNGYCHVRIPFDLTNLFFAIELLKSHKTKEKQSRQPSHD